MQDLRDCRKRQLHGKTRRQRENRLVHVGIEVRSAFRVATTRCRCQAGAQADRREHRKAMREALPVCRVLELLLVYVCAELCLRTDGARPIHAAYCAPHIVALSSRTGGLVVEQVVHAARCCNVEKDWDIFPCFPSRFIDAAS